MKIESDVLHVINKARVARLATIDDKQPYLVPVVFVLYEGSIFIPIDKKSKQVNVDRLKRVRNIKQNPNVSLLIDEYYEDWNKLFYIMIIGKANIIKLTDELFETIKEKFLAKYPQYKTVGITHTCIVVRPIKVVKWKNEPT